MRRSIANLEIVRALSAQWKDVTIFTVQESERKLSLTSKDLDGGLVYVVLPNKFSSIFTFVLIQNAERCTGDPNSL
eukprot:12417949-Karenia_brevis.AAC.1